MTDETSNVIAFAPRPPEVKRRVHFCEFRLHPDATLSLSLLNEHEEIFGEITFGIQSVPPNFDVGLLVEAWALWKEYYATRTGIGA